MHSSAEGDIHEQLALALVLAIASTPAAAQTWPSRPITLIVPFAAGGALDLPARRLAAEIGPKLGQQIVVENRTGANGNIGAAAVAKAEPDGYTLLFAPPGVLVTNRFMYKAMPFDPDRAFTPVVLLAKSPLLIASSPKLPARQSQGADRPCQGQSRQAQCRHARASARRRISSWSCCSGRPARR